MKQNTQSFLNLTYLGIFGLLWNGAFGVLDYTLVALREPNYLAASAHWLRIPPLELVRYYDAWPDWAMAGWTASVWAGLAGSILLTLGDRYAALFFAVSLFGLFLLSYFLTLAPYPRVAGDDVAHWMELARTAGSITSFVHIGTVIVAILLTVPQRETR